MLPSGALSGGAPARAVSLCGVWPSCPSPTDEITAACPPTATGCAAGYYITYTFPDASASLPAILCTQCTNTVGCPLTYTYSPCQGGQQQNPCTPCAAPPASNMVYLPGGNCASLGCDVGYARTGTAQCAQCGVGTYQSVTGVTAIGVCPSCPAGTYAPSAAASACLICAAGWAPSPGADACTQCVAGTFSATAGAATCTACAVGTHYSLACASACTVCPAETPLSTGAACTVPTPSSGSICPAGFFFSSLICVGCPEGTYCPAGGGGPILCSPGTPPAPRLSSLASDCKAGAPGAWRSVAGDPVPCPAYTSTYGLTGATSSAWCYPMRGYYGLPGAVAQPCPYDAYCAPTARVPTPCPPATPFASFRSTSLSNCTASMAQPCRPGYYVAWNVVVMDGSGSSACQPCPTGSYCLGQVWPDGTRVPPQTPSGNNALACPDSSYAWYTDQGASAVSMCRAPAPFPTLYTICDPNTVTVEASKQPYSKLQCRAAAKYYLLPGTSAALICPPGYYCPQYGVEPLACTTASSCADMSKQPNASPCANQGTSTPGDACVPCTTPATGGLPPGGYWATNCVWCCNAGYWTPNLTPLACVAVDSNCAGVGRYLPAVPACASNLPACTDCPAPPMYGAVALPSAAGFGVAVCRYACPAGTCANGSACTPAAPGFYATMAGVCTSCPSGTYRRESGGTACLACPPGALALIAVAQSLCQCGPGLYASFYANSNNVTQQQCVPCPPGTVALAAGCQTCVAGTVWAPFSIWLMGACGPGTFRVTPTSACQPCQRGTYAMMGQENEATACAACAQGTYASLTGRSICEACAAGTYVDRNYYNDGCAPCPMNGSVFASSQQPCACPIGTFLDGALCLSCASRCGMNGTFVVARTRRATGCTVAGVTASDFACAPSAAACPEDTYYYYYNHTTTCATCRVCPALATTASRCAVNSTRDTVRCVCPLGYYYRWGDCFPCTRTCGPYATLAVMCALGATDDTSVCMCTGGAYGNGVQCVCPELTYRHPNGTCVACAKCGANETYISTCLAGTTADTTLCYPLVCEAGKYAALPNATACLTCAMGTYTNASGLRTCFACVAGTYVNGTGATACIACPLGQFANSSSTACLACAMGTYTNALGLSACLACRAGTYGNGTGATACIACPIGQFANRSSSTACLACAMGTYTNASGLGTCFACRAGTYGNSGTGATACIACPVGQFANSSSTACLTCPLGRFGNTSGLSACFDCVAGTYGTGATTCIACPLGKFSSSSSSTACTACAVCGAQYTYAATCLEGATADTTLCITRCDAGKYPNLPTATATCLSCAMGTYTNASGLSTCFACVAGTYGNSGTGATACIACPVGQFANIRSSACLTCPLGRFGNASGLSICLACVVGTYLNQINNTACTACAVGKYNTVEGMWIPIPSASLDMGAVTSNGIPVSLGTGQYCANMLINTVITRLGYVSPCHPDLACPWAEYPLASSFCVRLWYYYTTAGNMNSSYQCKAGCRRSASCVNGANGVFTGPGTVSNNSASCPVACNPGFYLSGSNYCVAPTVCPNCALGKYAVLAGVTTCLDCALGKYAALAGATTCLNCAMGTYASASLGVSACFECVPGTYLNQFDDTACTACAVGKYCTMVGAWNPTTTPSAFLAPVSSSNGVPVSVGTGQYCSMMNEGYSTTIMVSPCYPDPRCPWAQSFNLCVKLDPPYEAWLCLPGCITAASCVNGANGVFTGRGYVGSSASCPVTCNPGFYASTPNKCVASPICLTCASGTYATRAGATACTP